MKVERKMRLLIIIGILTISIIIAYLMKFLDIIIDAKEMEIKLTKKQIWNVWQNNIIHGKDIYDQLYEIKVINNIKKIRD